MAVPKKRTTRAKQGSRRAHDSLSAPRLVACSNCGAQRRPHMVCSSCGYYNGKKVVKV